MGLGYAHAPRGGVSAAAGRDSCQNMRPLGGRGWGGGGVVAGVETVGRLVMSLRIGW